MEKRKVVKNVRLRNPILFYAVVYLFLDKYNIPQWIYGALGILGLIWFVIFAIDRWNNVSVDLFKEEPHPNVAKPKSKWQQRLEDAAKKKGYKPENN
jgi:hypothetical protein